jgi:mono/diheme cytochrome c family protein
VQLVWSLLRALALIVVVAASITGAVVFRGWQLANGREKTRAVPLTVAPGDSLRARGEHLVTLACVGCHTPDGRPPLAGGKRNVLARERGPWLGEAYAPNLTSAGVLPRTDASRLARAIREGIGHDGRTLLAMPTHRFRHLSDRDAAAIIAYLESQPAVRGTLLPRRFSPAGLVALGLGRVPLSRQPAIGGPVRHVAAGSPEYGRYLARYLGCNDCHGPDFRGGADPRLAHPGPDLVKIATEQPLATFDRAVRQGISTSGRRMKPEAMPARLYAALSDSELVAIHRYLRDGAIWD